MELNMKAGNLKDFLKLIALPTDGKTAAFNPTAPTFYPDGRISVIAKNSGIVARIQIRNQNIIGINEAKKIPIQPLKLLDYIGMYSDDSDVSLLFDDDMKEIRISGITNGMDKTVTMSSIVTDDITSVLDEHPMKFDDNGNPLFKNGQITPNVSSSLDVKFFQSQISDAEKIKVDPRIYYIEFDGNAGTVTTKVGDPSKRDKDKIIATSEVVESMGSGAVSYALGFEEVMGNLDGIIDILTIGGGPLWVSQKSEDIKAEFLISPSVIKGGSK